MAVLVLRMVLILQFIWVLAYTACDIIKNKRHLMAGKDRYAKNAVIGLVTDFFDTLGVGSFAPTMFAFKITGSMPKDEYGKDRDDLVPGTLNVGHSLPVIAEALLFLDFVAVEPITLVGLLAAACFGGWIGAGWVSKWKVNTVRISLAVCLLATAIVVIMKLFGIGPYAGENEALLGLRGTKLIAAIIINFVLGMLMNLGFGLYAPCMGMLLALGMDVGAIFPIMMGSTALQMPFSSIIFIKEGKYDPKAAVMLGAFGIIGVFLAYFLVRSMDITYLLYIVICIMMYTAVRYFIEGIRGIRAEGKEKP
ncbi:MAG: permease [Clostridia bacterium]|nr:permease [Clostridia bacterium]